MISRRVWVSVALVSLVLVPAATFLAYRHPPSGDELRDPLGLSVRLTYALVGSAQAFEDITEVQERQQSIIAARTVALRDVASDLDRLEQRTTRLRELASTLDGQVAQAGVLGRQLPPLLRSVRGRATDGAVITQRLSTTSRSLSTRVGQILGSAQSIQQGIEAIRSRTRIVADRLEQIAEATSVLRALRLGNGR